MVYIWGAAKPASDTQAKALPSSDGMIVCWFSRESKFPMGRIWVPVAKGGVYPHAVNQGSGTNRWASRISGDDGTDIRAGRYGPSTTPNTNTWLPFFMSWPAPSVKTWESPWVAGD